MHLLYKKITLRQFTYSLWEKIRVLFDITVFCNLVTIEGGVVLFLYGTILEHLVLLDYLLMDVWQTVNDHFCFAAIQIYNTSWKPSGPPKMSRGNKAGFYAINSKLQWVYMDSSLKIIYWLFLMFRSLGNACVPFAYMWAINFYDFWVMG